MSVRSVYHSLGMDGGKGNTGKGNHGNNLEGPGLVRAAAQELGRLCEKHYAEGRKLDEGAWGKVGQTYPDFKESIEAIKQALLFSAEKRRDVNGAGENYETSERDRLALYISTLDLLCEMHTFTQPTADLLADLVVYGKRDKERKDDFQANNDFNEVLDPVLFLGGGNPTSDEMERRLISGLLDQSTSFDRRKALTMAQVIEQILAGNLKISNS